MRCLVLTISSSCDIFQCHRSKGFSSFSLSASWRWRRCLHQFGDLLQLDNRTLSTSTTRHCATQLKWDRQMLRIAWPKQLLMALRMASKHLTRKQIIAIIAPDSDASSDPKIRKSSEKRSQSTCKTSPAVNLIPAIFLLMRFRRILMQFHRSNSFHCLNEIVINISMLRWEVACVTWERNFVQIQRSARKRTNEKSFVLLTNFLSAQKANRSRHNKRT